MKIIAFAVRADEAAAFDRFEKDLGIEVKRVAEALSLKNVALVEGYEGVTILGNDDASAAVLEKLSGYGVKYLASRSVGYNNVDTEAAKRLGIRFSNATYSPNCVADFTMMHILMAIRKMKRIAKRTDALDYGLAGNQGREMHNLTFGIIGTGRIGAAVAHNLTGFGGKILGYDVYQNDGLKSILDYVSLDELLARSDVITIHAPLFKENYHLLNTESIAKMKDGVVLVNCARGELLDTDALIAALESGKVSAAGLDVLEGELGIFHTDHAAGLVKNSDLARLERFPNVTITPHIAFYTDQAVSDMVEVALRSLNSFGTTQSSQWEIK